MSLLSHDFDQRCFERKDRTTSFGNTAAKQYKLYSPNTESEKLVHHEHVRYVEMLESLCLSQRFNGQLCCVVQKPHESEANCSTNGENQTPIVF